MISGHPRPPHGAHPDGSSATPADAVPTVELTAILGTGREAVILHKGERYRLRVTANDKLILTK
ncbi:MAG: hemin uptake protein HemP [Rhizobiales bacterium]|nr:hemin uptake protein HemP [Hyphomicrobiales bacterium]